MPVETNPETKAKLIAEWRAATARYEREAVGTPEWRLAAADLKRAQAPLLPYTRTTGENRG